MFVTIYGTEHGLYDIIFYFIRGEAILEEIGNLFLLTRESAGVSIKEASQDLDIEEAILENIEDGRSGAFADIFKLKEYVYNYAKYLGLDPEKIIDTFNEYVFETTSKIPIKQIEKQIKNQEEDKNIIKSPYTMKEKKEISGIYLFVYIVLVLALIAAVFWSIKTITVSASSATVISTRK